MVNGRVHRQHERVVRVMRCDDECDEFWIGWRKEAERREMSAASNSILEVINCEI